MTRRIGTRRRWIRRINKKGDREEEEEIGKKDVYREGE